MGHAKATVARGLAREIRRGGVDSYLQQVSVWLTHTHDEHIPSRPKGSLDYSHILECCIGQHLRNPLLLLTKAESMDMQLFGNDGTAVWI